uniref:Helitron_like_N domain-containing protein n=1 Tax=Echinococcus granulosus TaxID=6210 RepID=A0A068WZE2_ECHGR|nr:hypothetical protein EgrG_002034600 [Echinococcus granulosus]
MPVVHILPEYYIFFVFRSLGALHWWQRKANLILKDDYPDFDYSMMNLNMTEERHMLRMGQSVKTCNSRFENDLYTRQLLQSRVLQE